MKLTKYSFIIILTLTIKSYAFLGLFGGIKTTFKNEMKKLQNSTEKKLSDIKAGINDVQLKIGNIQNTLKAQINLQNQIKAGLDKSNNLSAGRDITTTTTTTNDTKLLIKIFSGISAIFMAIIGFMTKSLKSRAKTLRQTQEKFFKYMAEKDKIIQEKDKFIEKLVMAMADDWKEALKMSGIFNNNSNNK